MSMEMTVTFKIFDEAVDLSLDLIFLNVHQIRNTQVYFYIQEEDCNLNDDNSRIEIIAPLFDLGVVRLQFQPKQFFLFCPGCVEFIKSIDNQFQIVNIIPIAILDRILNGDQKPFKLSTSILLYQYFIFTLQNHIYFLRQFVIFLKQFELLF